MACPWFVKYGKQCTVRALSVLQGDPALQGCILWVCVYVCVYVYIYVEWAVFIKIVSLLGIITNTALLFVPRTYSMYR